MKIEQRPKVECECTIRLTEGEMRFLDAMVGYGWKSFIETFEKHMGQSYVRDYKQSGEVLFHTIREHIPPILARVNDARAVFSGEKIAQHPPKPDQPC
jgi:hypothetical protein